MAKTSVLRFTHYTVEDIRFRSVQVSEDKHEFELHPHFKRDLMEVGEHLYDLKFTMEILSSEKQQIPFDLIVSLTGHFALEDDEVVSENQKETILKNNTVAILFPFLRAIVASITTAANIPPLVLPVMNFADDSNEESD